MIIEYFTEGRALGDWVSATIALGSLVNWLPALSAMLSILWMAIRIYETRTVQGWLGRTIPADDQTDD